jgi:hypothetical protein
LFHYYAAVPLLVLSTFRISPTETNSRKCRIRLELIHNCQKGVPTKIRCFEESNVTVAQLTSKNSYSEKLILAQGSAALSRAEGTVSSGVAGYVVGGTR